MSHTHIIQFFLLLIFNRMFLYMLLQIRGLVEWHATFVTNEFSFIFTSCHVTLNLILKWPPMTSNDPFSNLRLAFSYNWERPPGHFSLLKSFPQLSQTLISFPMILICQRYCPIKRRHFENPPSAWQTSLFRCCFKPVNLTKATPHGSHLKCFSWFSHSISHSWLMPSELPVWIIQYDSSFMTN